MLVSPGKYHFVIPGEEPANPHKTDRKGDFHERRWKCQT
jgi:hypothetical protein